MCRHKSESEAAVYVFCALCLLFSLLRYFFVIFCYISNLSFFNICQRFLFPCYISYSFYYFYFLFFLSLIIINSLFFFLFCAINMSVRPFVRVVVTLLECSSMCELLYTSACPMVFSLTPIFTPGKARQKIWPQARQGLHRNKLMAKLEEYERNEDDGKTLLTIRI